jgi:hypothetical protein
MHGLKADHLVSSGSANLRIFHVDPPSDSKVGNDVFIPSFSLCVIFTEFHFFGGYAD